MCSLTRKVIVELDAFIDLGKSMEKNYVACRQGLVADCRKLKGYDDSKTIVENGIVEFGCCYFMDTKSLEDGLICNACICKSAYDYKQKIHNMSNQSN